MSSRNPSIGNGAQLDLSRPTLSEAIGRAEARLHALSVAKDLARSGEIFHPPNAPFEGQSELVKELEKHALGLGIFAARLDWFEAQNIESWLRSLCKRIGFEPVFLYPRSESSFEMSFRVSNQTDLVESPHFAGLMEAPASAPKQIPSLVFVPCSIADSYGHRMGRGKGFYDRYLAQHSQIESVGVVHTRFLRQSFPESWIQGHDQTMDALLTEKQFLRPLTKETVL